MNAAVLVRMAGDLRWGRGGRAAPGSFVGVHFREDVEEVRVGGWCSLQEFWTCELGAFGES
jgi:hypothetical protein